uniref:39S ribosomal protein L38, mitochondrial n=1 Tax=Rhabditophanes sp. KR3021 TaxID=114890 RepID=A0AC35U0I4_9BILA
MVRGKSIYASVFVKNSYRAKCSPRVRRPMRPRAIAWAGPDAFYPNRFYEMDRWYKARITRPEILPQLHIVNGQSIVKSFEELTAKPLVEGIDIGFKVKDGKKVASVSSKEELAKLDEIVINLGKVSFNQTAIFNHYNIFGELFQDNAFFNVTQNIKVTFNEKEVQRGNVLTPSDASTLPSVEIESLGTSSYNTMFMLNLDGNAFTESGQTCHWMVSNIPDSSDLSQGETVVEYLQPMPFKGTGFHRVVFLSFRHKEKIDFSAFRPLEGGIDARVFHMRQFYKVHEKDITPAAMSFCQMEWDESVDETCQKIGNQIASFAYEWRSPLKRAQKEFPEKAQPFDLYFDMYRPKEKVHQELEKIKMELASSKGKGLKPAYIDIDYVENKKKLPAWQHSRLLRKNGGSDYYSKLYE